MNSKLTKAASRTIARQFAQFGLASALLLAVSGSSLAGTVTISKDTARQHMIITTKEASLRDILSKLADEYGFKLEIKSQLAVSAGWSTTLSGDIDSLLSRLLRNQNYFVIRSGDAGRVSKVVLLSNVMGAAISVPSEGAKGLDWRRLPVKKHQESGK